MKCGILPKKLLLEKIANTLKVLVYKSNQRKKEKNNLACTLSLIAAGLNLARFTFRSFGEIKFGET